MGRKTWKDQKLIDRAISNQSAKSYWANIHELRERASDEIYDRALCLAKSENVKEKITGIDILAQFGVNKRPKSGAVVRVFLDLLLKEDDPDVINSLLVGLGHNGQCLKKKDIEKIVFFKDHEESFVRYGLVFALLGKSQAVAVDTLIDLSQDKSQPVRDWATFGLGTGIEKNNRKIRDALWVNTQDQDEDTRQEAILGLAKRKDLRVQEVIISELLEGEHGTLLFESIQETGDKELLKYLTKALSECRKNKNINPDWVKKLKACIKAIKAV